MRVQGFSVFNARWAGSNLARDEQEFIHLPCGMQNASPQSLSLSLRQINTKKKLCGVLRRKLSLPIKADPPTLLFKYFLFEQLFNFAVDVYESRL